MYLIICFLLRWSVRIRIQNDIQFYSRISYLRMLLFIIHIDLQQMNSLQFILKSHVVFTSFIYFISINKSIQFINQNDISILKINNSLQKQSFSFHNLFLSYRYSYHHNLLVVWDWRLLRENFWPKFLPPQVITTRGIPKFSRNRVKNRSDFCHPFLTKIGNILREYFWAINNWVMSDVPNILGQLGPNPHTPTIAEKSANYCHQLGHDVRLFLTIMGCRGRNAQSLTQSEMR